MSTMNADGLDRLAGYLCVVLILGDTEHQQTFRSDWKNFQVD